MEPLYLPAVRYFENNNRFSGSFQGMRFMIKPDLTMKNKKEVDLEASSVKAEVWHQDLCYDLSEMESEEVFPLSKEGLESLYQWLMEHIET